jgi:tRNA (mo5U34)-methyltransferase
VLRSQFIKKLRARSGHYGVIDKLTISGVEGWAIDLSFSPRPAQIAVLVHGRVVAVAEASSPRPDVLEHGYPSACCGYQISVILTPKDLFEGAVSVVFWRDGQIGPELSLGEVLVGVPPESRTVKKLTNKEMFYQIADKVKRNRGYLLEEISSDPEFSAAGGIIFPYDTLRSNIDIMFNILNSSGFIDEFETGKIKSVCDIGCANGEIALCFSLLGMQTSAIDFSFKHDQAPFVVSRMAQAFDAPLGVSDMSVDKYFSLEDIRNSQVFGPKESLPQEKFDLIVCFGLLHHLKNPLSFLESIANLAERVIIGTNLFTHLPNQELDLSDRSLAYFVDSDELNNDPTNFWMFTDKAFQRLVRRAGYEIISVLKIANTASGVAVPDRPDLGMRGFLALKPL